MSTWRSRGRPALHRPKIDYGTLELQEKRRQFQITMNTSSNRTHHVKDSQEASNTHETTVVTLADYLNRRQVLEDWEQDFLKQYHHVRCRALIQQKRLPTHIGAIYKKTGNRSVMQRENLEKAEAQWVIFSEKLPVAVIGCFDDAVLSPLDYDISACDLNIKTVRLTQCLVHYAEIIQIFLKGTRGLR